MHGHRLMGQEKASVEVVCVQLKCLESVMDPKHDNIPNALVQLFLEPINFDIRYRDLVKVCFETIM